LIMKAYSLDPSNPLVQKMLNKPENSRSNKTLSQ